MAKTAITVNGPEPNNIFPAMILGSAAAACGDDVVIFFNPGGSPTMLKGALEKIKAKGMPDIVELYESIRILGGRMIACELCVGAKDIKPEDLREGVEIMGATSFFCEINDAQLTFSF